MPSFRGAKAGIGEPFILRERGALNWDLGYYMAAVRDYDRLIETKPDAI